MGALRLKQATTTKLTAATEAGWFFSAKLAASSFCSHAKTCKSGVGIQQQVCVYSIKGAATKFADRNAPSVVATTTYRSLSGRAIAACQISRTPLLSAAVPLYKRLLFPDVQ